MPRTVYVLEVGKNRFYASDMGDSSILYPTLGLRNVDAADHFDTKADAQEAIDFIRDDEENLNFERHQNGQRPLKSRKLTIRKLVTTLRVI